MISKIRYELFDLVLKSSSRLGSVYDKEEGPCEKRIVKRFDSCRRSLSNLE